MVLIEKLKRPKALAAAALLVLASLMPLLSTAGVSAISYTLLGPRQIKMSDSKANAASLSYRVRFSVKTGGNLGAIVVAFCDGASTPIIGDTDCVHPTGFSLTGAGVSGQSTAGTDTDPDAPGGSVATDNISSLTTVNILNEDNTGTNPNTFVLSNGTAATVTANHEVYFTITGVHNPSTTGTFYARIYTYAAQADGQGYTLADPNAVGPTVDAGGIALSTANQLTITSKVQERLTFCVYTSTPSGSDDDCTLGTGTGNSLLLGDTNGVLDNTTQYTSNAYFGVSTNANGLTANSVFVRMKGATLKSTPGCADGTTQPCSIDPVGSTTTAGTTGTEQFGLRVTASGAPLAAYAPYNGGANNYAFDDANTCGVSNCGTNSTYGATIAEFNASIEKTATMEFVGNIAATTEPGIYQTTLSFIATGTY